MPRHLPLPLSQPRYAGEVTPSLTTHHYNQPDSLLEGLVKTAYATIHAKHVCATVNGNKVNIKMQGTGDNQEGGPAYRIGDLPLNGDPGTLYPQDDCEGSKNDAKYMYHNNSELVFQYGGKGGADWYTFSVPPR